MGRRVHGAWLGGPILDHTRLRATGAHGWSGSDMESISDEELARVIQRVIPRGVGPNNLMYQLRAEGVRIGYKRMSRMFKQVQEVIETTTTNNGTGRGKDNG